MIVNQENRVDIGKAACISARKKRFSGSLIYNLSKGKQKDIRSEKEERISW